MGYRQDTLDGQSNFTKEAEKGHFVKLLQAIKGQPDEVMALVKFSLIEAAKARKMLLNLSTPEVTAEDDDQAGNTEQKRKAAAERKAKLMAQMAQQRNNFAKEHASDLSEVSKDRDLEEKRVLEQETVRRVAVGPNRGKPVVQNKR